MLTDEQMIDALADIRDEMVRRRARQGSPMVVVPELSADLLNAAKSLALYTVLVTLDSWIEAAVEHHAAMGHRDEKTGDECWRSFAPSDFRDMINDAARELGLSEFPLPEKPKEDTVS